MTDYHIMSEMLAARGQVNTDVIGGSSSTLYVGAFEGDYSRLGDQLSLLLDVPSTHTAAPNDTTSGGSSDFTAFNAVDDVIDARNYNGGSILNNLNTYDFEHVGDSDDFNGGNDFDDFTGNNTDDSMLFTGGYKGDVREINDEPDWEDWDIKPEPYAADVYEGGLVARFRDPDSSDDEPEWPELSNGPNTDNSMITTFLNDTAGGASADSPYTSPGVDLESLSVVIEDTDRDDIPLEEETPLIVFESGQFQPDRADPVDPVDPVDKESTGGGSKDKKASKKAKPATSQPFSTVYSFISDYGKKIKPNF
jgi:hypothetical protein